MRLGCGGLRTRLSGALGCAVALAAAALSGGCDRAQPRATPSAPAAGEPSANAPKAAVPRPNVVLISMDTTRADHLGCYGSTARATPNLDRFAADATLFRQFVTVTPVTLPAHTTMMTGVDPPSHGVRDNAVFHVHPNNVTLAEHLKAAGYQTAAFVSAHVLRSEYGLDQGFDRYEDDFAAGQARGLSRASMKAERPADAVTNVALKWFESKPAGPYFLFVHYYDPHSPYNAPEPYRSQFAEPYTAEIAFMDAQIGRLLEAVDARGGRTDTLVAIVADHGESLGEHGEDTHGVFLYDATMRIPLLLRGPGVPAGRQVQAQARMCDLAPTLADLLGVSPMRPAVGRSLRALLSRDDDGPRPAYMETFYPKYSYGLAWYRAWRAASFKYIHGVRPELYDLSADPGELTNLAGNDSDRHEHMRTELREYVAAAVPAVSPEEARQAISASERQALLSLGYVSGGAEDEEPAGELELFDPVGPEPRDQVAEGRKMRTIVDAIRDSRLDVAEPALRELIAAPDREATFTWAHLALAQVLVLQKRDSDAVEHFRLALQARPTDNATRGELADTLVRLNRMEEALLEFDLAIRHGPVLAETHNLYGRALAQAGRVDDAIAQQQAALKLDAEFSAARVDLAGLLAKQGRVAEAEQEYRTAIQHSPNDAEAHGRLAQLLLGQRRPKDALSEFEAALAADPQDARSHGGRGTTLMALGRPAEAVENLKKATELDPSLPQGWQVLGDALIATRRYSEAIAAYRAGLEKLPDEGSLRFGLAWLLAACPVDALRDGAEALKLTEFVEAGGAAPLRGLDARAAALAEVGRFDEAVQVIDAAIQALESRGANVTTLRERRALYAASKPYRLPAP